MFIIKCYLESGCKGTKIGVYLQYLEVGKVPKGLPRESIKESEKMSKNICGREKALKLVKNEDYLSFLFYLCTINYS